MDRCFEGLVLLFHGLALRCRFSSLRVRFFLRDECVQVSLLHSPVHDLKRTILHFFFGFRRIFENLKVLRANLVRPGLVRFGASLPSHFLARRESVCPLVVDIGVDRIFSRLFELWSFCPGDLEIASALQSRASIGLCHCLFSRISDDTA